MTAAHGQARVNKSIPKVSWSVARYVASNSDGTVQVDFGEGQITVLSAGLYAPRPGEAVRVLRVNSETVMIGPSAPKLSQGTVVATGSPNLTVNTSAGQLPLPYLASYGAPAVGDTVLIDWSLGAVLGKLTTTPVSTYEPPPKPSVRKDHRSEFNAQWAGTFYVPGSRWNADTVAAVGTGNNIGAWGYGTAVDNTIPDGATIQKAWIFLKENWNRFPGTPTRLGTHTRSSRSGEPTLTGSHPVSSGSGWREIPVSFAERLQDGSARGIGTGLSGLAQYKSLGEDSWSGRLRIDWTG